MIEKLNEERVKELCSAIVMQACKEYREAYKSNSKNALKRLNRFFYGSWFEQLTNSKIDPDYILRELRQQVDEKRDKALRQREKKG